MANERIYTRFKYSEQLINRSEIKCLKGKTVVVPSTAATGNTDIQFRCTSFRRTDGN